MNNGVVHRLSPFRWLASSGAGGVVEADHSPLSLLFGYVVEVGLRPILFLAWALVEPVKSGVISFDPDVIGPVSLRGYCTLDWQVADHYNAKTGFASSMSCARCSRYDYNVLRMYLSAKHLSPNRMPPRFALCGRYLLPESDGTLLRAAGEPCCRGEGVHPMLSNYRMHVPRQLHVNVNLLFLTCHTRYLLGTD